MHVLYTFATIFAAVFKKKIEDSELSDRMRYCITNRRQIRTVNSIIDISIDDAEMLFATSRFSSRSE